MCFWVIFVLFGVIWFPCILLFAFEGTTLKHKINGSLICLGLWFLVAVGCWGQEQGNTKRWNDGYCPSCEIHWELSAVSKSKSGTETRYYSCPKCFTEIKIIH